MYLFIVRHRCRCTSLSLIIYLLMTTCLRFHLTGSASHSMAGVWTHGCSRRFSSCDFSGVVYSQVLSVCSVFCLLYDGSPCCFTCTRSSPRDLLSSPSRAVHDEVDRLPFRLCGALLCELRGECTPLKKSLFSAFLKSCLLCECAHIHCHQLSQRTRFKFLLLVHVVHSGLSPRSQSDGSVLELLCDALCR